MTVYRRETKQGVRFVCDFWIAGHRVNHTLKGAATLREARAAEARLREEYQARLNASGSIVKLTLETAIQRYAAERLKPKAKPAALATYLTYLGMIREFFGPARQVATINNAAVSEWWSALLAGQGGGKGAVKPNTAKRYLGQLKAVLAFAAEAGAGNIVPGFSPSVADDARIRWLSDEEEDALLAASPRWLRDFIVLSVETGARKSEALAVRWRDVDLGMQPRPVVRLVMETKGSKPRGIPLSRRAERLLTRLRRERPDARPDDRVLLWPERGGDGAVPIGDFKKAWAAVTKAAGVADVRPHDLRHTFASRLVMRRVPLYDVSKLLGHASLKMTMRYAHLAPESLNGAIAALDEARTPPSSRRASPSGRAPSQRPRRAAMAGDAPAAPAPAGEAPMG